MRRTWLTIAVLCAAMTGCARKDESGGHLAMALQAPMDAEVAATEATDAAGKASAANPTLLLAYERTLSLDVPDERIADAYHALESACRSAVATQCVVLDAQLQADPEHEAHLRLRATPEGIRALTEQAGSLGHVVQQGATAEDLTGPITDQAKQLEMLTDYRARLEGLRGQAGHDIDALIRVNKELADVQQQIESLSGEKAQLLRRVHTETLTIAIESGQQRSFWRPVHRALRDFGENLAEALGGIITAVAVLLPWLVALAVLFWGWRTWRARRRGR